ncbi:hypothetical protein SS50377_20425 [Spironucleus salmonicida]|uniref:Uncharacterized protein n=1 Tax=Spironucleus salmonicida TaxID=348837 RepID=V6LMY6_9EUKA|nr:hypothetical protein SS50377_20425 [Spironucleus salmonicida]|eukprot:EST45583.1 Hypothetical protein SS50377_14429 [Spironucleus salmonicida]
MNYDELLTMKSRALRLSTKDAQKSLELTLQYLQNAPYDQFVEKVLSNAFREEFLHLIAQIVPYCPYSAVQALPNTNETRQYKAQLSKSPLLASQTDYFVKFDTFALNFEYFILLLTNHNFKYADIILSQYPESEEMQLLFQIVSKNHETAFKLFKSKYAAELKQFSQLLQKLQEACFAPKEGVVQDCDQDELD